ncbi:MAG: SurA N-terminal domain-containing protein [Endomicrobiaceae bacterium]|nr:SurA N-terminal domain-containing protein [Endomicrobiaceae bacterium]
MKKAVSLLLFVCLTMVGCVNQQNQKSTVVATVNGVEISSADFDSNLEKAIKIVQAQNPQSLQQPNAQDIIGKRILQDMILKEVFLQQAKKSKIEATQEEIDAVVSKVKEQFKVNAEGKELTPEEQEKAFENALKAQNISKEKYLSNVANDIIIEKYRRGLISKNLKPVTQEEAKIFYNNVSAIYNNDTKKVEELKKSQGRYEEAAIVANQLKASLAPKAQFDLILVYADKNMPKEELAQRKQIANTIRKEIKDKSNFADVANKYAQQKDSRIYFSTMNVFEGMQPVELTSRAFKMNVGEVSNVFEIFKDNAGPNVAQGYLIMNVVEKVAGQKFTYESFEKQLEAYINTKRAESILAQATQALVKEADIKVLKTFEMDKVAQSSQTAA